MQRALGEGAGTDPGPDVPLTGVQELEGMDVPGAMRGNRETWQAGVKAVSIGPNAAGTAFGWK